MEEKKKGTQKGEIECVVSTIARAFRHRTLRNAGKSHVTVARVRMRRRSHLRLSRFEFLLLGTCQRAKNSSRSHRAKLHGAFFRIAV